MPSSHNQSECDELRRRVEAVCATEQPEMIHAAVTMLTALLNGALALSFARRYEIPFEESVREFLHRVELKAKKGPKQ